MDPGEEILRRVVRETRSDAVPEPDWDALETRLMRRVRSGEPPRTTSRSWHTVALPGLALAGAALAAVLWLRPAPRPGSAGAPVSMTSSGSGRDGDELALDSSVRASEEPVTIQHRGRARWTLAPHSAATLLERSERVVVRLESGAMEANVVPSGRDAFTVEVGQAKVTVRGTVFKVELRGDRIRVAVSEGSVGIAPRSSTGTPTFVLEAGSRGDFSLDGRTGHIDKAERVKPQPSAPKSKAAAAGDREAQAAAAQASPPPAPSALPAQPSISDIESGVMDLVNVTGSCFTRHTAPGDGVEVTVRTAVALHIGPDGLVTDLEFSPPLSPAVDACAESGIRQLSFGRSSEGTKITRLLELKR
jgi:hypothetical protein